MKKSEYICNIHGKLKRRQTCYLVNCREAQSIFVNTGRCSVIGDDSLMNAIEKGWLKAAILDVFNKEPMSRKSKLWEFPNGFITSHAAGLSLDEEVCNWVNTLSRYEASSYLWVDDRLIND